MRLNSLYRPNVILSLLAGILMLLSYSFVPTTGAKRNLMSISCHYKFRPIIVYISIGLLQA